MIGLVRFKKHVDKWQNYVNVKYMLTLGIETSCDDTSVAIYDNKKGMLYNKRHSQLELHNRYGGVFPELASRDHQVHLLPLFDDALHATDLSATDIDVIAYTAGPGLIGSLFVGASFAHGLGLSLNKPVIPVHHHLAHIEIARYQSAELTYPYLALLVSGGHTFIILLKAINVCEVIGSTVDDAVGEALDKSARIMSLPYPGGPEIERLANQVSETELKLPRPMLKDPGLSMSFSGLKTAVINTFNDNQYSSEEIAFALQKAIADVLVIKTKRALKLNDVKHLVFCGGVAANKYLGDQLKDVCHSKNISCHIPEMSYCTDNGAMVAFTGSELYLAGAYDTERFVEPGWSLNDI
ncbi:MAG: tRNA (adenosine(37)-N6)-threonylcarbamoyltransferase complex transferase subunit TsaD [Pseudomonadota bacterium]|nr:tRNA (adenosine(37)-N6)-threonylcarbamoyltransferase complex transferase subunit TsaD [Pseudomonadota bacterium]